MTPEPSSMEQLSAEPSDFHATLQQVVDAVRHHRGDRPSSATVVAALLQAEKAAKQQRLTYPLQGLWGEWQLYFTAPRQAHLKGNLPRGKGFYVPPFAPAQIGFHPVPESDPEAGTITISNQIRLGVLLLRLTGPARYLGKKNLLAFDFTTWRFCIGGRTVYQGEMRGGKLKAEQFATQSIAHLPFFAFFFVSDDLIAARGRGGGLAIWVRNRANTPPCPKPVARP